MTGIPDQGSNGSVPIHLFQVHFTHQGTKAAIHRLKDLGILFWRSSYVVCSSTTYTNRYTKVWCKNENHEMMEQLGPGFLEWHPIHHSESMADNMTVYIYLQRSIYLSTYLSIYPSNLPNLIWSNPILAIHQSIYERAERGKIFQWLVIQIRKTKKLKYKKQNKEVNKQRIASASLLIIRYKTWSNHHLGNVLIRKSNKSRRGFPSSPQPSTRSTAPCQELTCKDGGILHD